MKHVKTTRPGLTLIELIISIAIIGIIVVSFMPLFVTSSKTNSKSETMLDSTYLGKDAMEVAYSLSRDIEYEKLEDILHGTSGDNDAKEAYEKIDDKVYEDIGEGKFGYEYNDNKYLLMAFTKDGNLIKVTVKIYKDKNMNQLEIQYESLYSWKGRGILQ